MERISKVSLAILRLGVYEIVYSEDVDDDIVVSECVKLAAISPTKRIFRLSMVCWAASSGR